MNDKVLVVISTAEVEKAYAGMMYAVNALKQNWMSDVKLIFFGPSEKLLLEDEGMKDFLSQFNELKGESVACKFISDRDETSVKIEKLGVKIEFVGSLISDYVKKGFIPMIW